MIKTDPPLILVTNDDGFDVRGIQVLTRLMRALGEVVVLAPDGPRSGQACAITVLQPVTTTLLHQEEGLTVYSCTGTPVDCVKLALEIYVPRKPDLVVSGINHGSNASISVHYSGTMGTVLEACMKGIPAIGFSLDTYAKDCDFGPCESQILSISRHILQRGLPQDVCLNVNFPYVPELRGLKVCRMARGIWNHEWNVTEREGEHIMTGTFVDLEPEATDTDLWALSQGMTSVVPIQLDLSHQPTLLNLSEEDLL